MAYGPAPSEITMRLFPVRRLLTVTAVPGTAEPEGSVTSPRLPPLVD